MLNGYKVKILSNKKYANKVRELGAKAQFVGIELDKKFKTQGVRDLESCTIFVQAACVEAFLNKT